MQHSPSPQDRRPRPVIPFGLPEDADTDALFKLIAGRAADQLKEDGRKAREARRRMP